MRITAWALVIGLAALAGCREEAAVGPSTQEFSTARQELAEKLAKGQAASPVVAQADPAGTPDESSGVAASGDDFRYDPRRLRDPFRPFTWQQMSDDLMAVQTRGPLEQFDMSQLSLVGVVWAVDSARALVQDPSGMSYIVAEGARIGRNEGRVISIDDNLVVVREIYVDSLGEETTKELEMRIRATEGG